MRVTFTNPLDARRLSSRCTAPEPEPVSPINSVAKKLREGWPNSSASMRCWVVVNSASARLVGISVCAAADLRRLGRNVRAGANMPISSILVPILGKVQPAARSEPKPGQRRAIVAWSPPAARQLVPPLPFEPLGEQVAFQLDS